MTSLMPRSIHTERSAHGGGILLAWSLPAIAKPAAKAFQGAALVLAAHARRAESFRPCTWSAGEVAWLYLAEKRGVRVSILRKEEPCV